MGSTACKREDTLWELGRLQNFSVLKGSLIHDAIREQITHHKLGRLVSPDAAKSFFSSKMNNIKTKPENYIIEAFNGLSISNDDFEKTSENGVNQLNTFFDIVWKNYSNLSYLSHEDLEKFKVDNIKVWVKLDLLTKSRDNNIIVTDWKTGTEHPKDELQAEVYALWVKSKFNIPEDEIVAEFVYLQEPTTRHMRISETRLKKRESHIISNANEILESNSEGDFPASPSDLKCKHCNFITICPDGREFLPHPED